MSLTGTNPIQQTESGEISISDKIQRAREDSAAAYELFLNKAVTGKISIPVLLSIARAHPRMREYLIKHCHLLWLSGDQAEILTGTQELASIVKEHSTWVSVKDLSLGFNHEPGPQLSEEFWDFLLSDNTSGDIETAKKFKDMLFQPQNREVLWACIFAHQAFAVALFSDVMRLMMDEVASIPQEIRKNVGAHFKAIAEEIGRLCAKFESFSETIVSQIELGTLCPLISNQGQLLISCASHPRVATIISNSPKLSSLLSQEQKLVANSKPGLMRRLFNFLMSPATFMMGPDPKEYEAAHQARIKVLENTNDFEEEKKWVDALLKKFTDDKSFELIYEDEYRLHVALTYAGLEERIIPVLKARGKLVVVSPGQLTCLGPMPLFTGTPKSQCLIELLHEMAKLNIKSVIPHEISQPVIDVMPPQSAIDIPAAPAAAPSNRSQDDDDDETDLIHLPALSEVRPAGDQMDLRLPSAPSFEPGQSQAKEFLPGYRAEQQRAAASTVDDLVGLEQGMAGMSLTRDRQRQSVPS